MKVHNKNSNSNIGATKCFAQVINMNKVIDNTEKNSHNLQLIEENKYSICTMINKSNKQFFEDKYLLKNYNNLCNE